MKISELMLELQKAYDEHGDLDVALNQGVSCCCMRKYIPNIDVECYVGVYNNSRYKTIFVLNNWSEQ